MVDGFAAVRRRVKALPPLTVDAVIAVLCYLATVTLPVKVATEGGWPLFVLAALASLPLVWRRRQPVVAAGLVGAGTIGLAVTGTLGSIPLPYGQLVATYTVASLAVPLWRLLVMVCTAVGVLISVLVLLGQSAPTLGVAALPFVETPVPHVLLFITLAGPAPSGSASTPRRCQDCSHPPRHLPDQAVLSVTALLRQGQRRRSHTSARIDGVSRRTG